MKYTYEEYIKNPKYLSFVKSIERIDKTEREWKPTILVTRKQKEFWDFRDKFWNQDCNDKEFIELTFHTLNTVWKELIDHFDELDYVYNNKRVVIEFNECFTGPNLCCMDLPPLNSKPLDIKFINLLEQYDQLYSVAKYLTYYADEEILKTIEQIKNFYHKGFNAYYKTSFYLEKDNKPVESLRIDIGDGEKYNKQDFEMIKEFLKE